MKLVWPKSFLPKHHLALALAISLGVHAFALYGIALAPPDPIKFTQALKPLQVALVNSRTESRPEHADALAQYNLNGGGNTSDDRVAKSPMPTLEDGKQFTPEQSAMRVRMLEQEVKRMITRMRSTHTVAMDKNIRNQAAGQQDNDLVQRSLEIARLEAQINKQYDAYQKLPRRRFIGARTQEYRFAQYVEDWRIKVERIGNLNYPAAARQQHLVGNLLLTVSIRADGSLENVEINRSSGKSLLDAAAIRIVRLAAPFSPLPPNIRRDTDILSITRTWTFTENDKLESE
ncbi:MAG TPA: energy transducer TonB [Gallionellaceae bacterium]|nr:energy transducer TonB [Gallionellaceae bacterium]